MISFMPDYTKDVPAYQFIEIPLANDNSAQVPTHLSAIRKNKNATFFWHSF